MYKDWFCFFRVSATIWILVVMQLGYKLKSYHIFLLSAMWILFWNTLDLHLFKMTKEINYNKYMPIISGESLDFFLAPGGGGGSVQCHV